MSVVLKPGRNKYRFCTGKQVYEQPVGSQRKCNGNKVRQSGRSVRRSAAGRKMGLFQGKGSDGIKGGKEFSCGNGPDGGRKRKCPTLLQTDPKGYPDKAHAGTLLCKLGDGRNSGMLKPIIIAVDTGMNAAERQGKGQRLKKRDTAFLGQEGAGNGIGEGIQRKGCGQGEQEGQRKAAPQGKRCLLPGSIGSDEPGNRGLDAGGTKGVQNGINRENELINSHSLCTDHPGEEYSIEESHDPGEKSRQGEKEGPADQRMGCQGNRFFHKNSVTVLFVNIFFYRA